MRKLRRPRGFSLIELMIALSILSILGSIAVPSFIRYTRRAATSEALMNLRRMYDGAVAYYLGEHTDASGVQLPQQFPVTVGPTPSPVPKGKKEQPATTAWDAEAWQALDFAVMQPVYFSYSFTSVGTGMGAFATMIAQGDLDGDDVLSHFSRTCTGVVEGVRGGSGVHVVDELE